MSDLSGRRVGAYELRARLGGGNTGEVYEGVEVSSDRRVAVKVLRREVTGVATAPAANALRHLGLVQVLGAAPLEPEGLGCLVMEFLDGQTLASIAGTKSLPVADVLRWAGEVLEVLVATHAAKLVHGALKTSNVFLIGEGQGRPAVKVLDFGLGATPGAQVQDDLSAFGRLVFELLTGSRAGSGDDFTGRPSQSRADLPWGVDELVMWAVETDPMNRPPSAAALLERLRSIDVTAPVRAPAAPVSFAPPVVSKEEPLELARPLKRAAPVSAAPVSAQARAPVPSSSNRGLIFGAIALLAVVAVFFGISRVRAARRADDLARVAELAPPVTTDWLVASMHGKASVTSNRQGGDCSLRCEVAGKEVWSHPTCAVAREADLKFVSDDCAVFAALSDAPIAELALGRTTVGFARGASGAFVALRLARLVGLGSDGRLVKLENANLGGTINNSPTGKWFSWLAGTVGNPGVKPRFSDDGQGIAFETLDGGKHLLTFEALSSWADVEPTRAELEIAQRAADAKEGLFQWVDERGTTQITTKDQIPQSARAKATPVLTR